MTQSYELSPVFGVRPAGVPFDVLERFSTPLVSEAARRLVALEREVDAASELALSRLREEVPDRTLQQFLKRKLLKRVEIPPERRIPWIERYDVAVRAMRAAVTELEELVWREYERVQDALLQEGARELPDFLTIEAEGFAADLDRMVTAGATTGHGNSERRKLDRTLALYLQRVCAKNDTISRFGPIAWGTVVPGVGAKIHPKPGVAARLIDVEYWVVKGLIDQINADPETRPELPVRLHPHGRLEGNVFHRIDQERDIALTDAERQIIARVDGIARAHELGDLTALVRLAEQGVVIWALEPMARDVVPLGSLISDVAGWRAGPLRDRWRGRLDRLAAYADRFGADPSNAARRKVISEVRVMLAELGVEQPENRRTLYAARNPIIENCFQAGEITLGASSVEQLVTDATPWFEMFRDAVSLAAARTFHRIHELVVAAPRRNGVLDYSTLGRIARQRGPSIDDDALSAVVATETFADLKREFAEELAGRPDAPAWQLTAEECAVLRRRHRFPLVGELSYPSADLQIMADSPEAAQAGQLKWLVAELHSAPVLLQHGTYWCCPDKPALARTLARVVEGRPFGVRDSGQGIPVHGSGEAMMDALALPKYIGTGRAKPGWHTVRPADAEVIVDEEACDVRLRAASGEDLGSIIRTPRMITAIHPFFPLELSPHTPRLMLGDVVVQRRSWDVDVEAFGPVATGVSAAFIAAVERVRADRGIPRRVFIRTAPGALREKGVLTRDKDNKPLYVDLESVVFLDILERRLRKYGKLVMTEMLPAPDHMVWHTPEGRYSFELRTNVLPR